MTDRLCTDSIRIHLVYRLELTSSVWIRDDLERSTGNETGQRNTGSDDMKCIRGMVKTVLRARI